MNDLKTHDLNNIKAQLEKAQKNLDECTSSVEELKNTPIERLRKAQNLQEQGEVSKAEEEYKELIDKYPDSHEGKTAKNILLEIEKKKEEEKIAREKEQLEMERRNRLGFKALKEENPITIGPIELKINSVSTQKRWTFDRYSYEYHYRDAQRGSKYIVVDVNISSESHDPQLPPIQVYKTSGENISYIGTLYYQFYKWQDYGSYLGNYADYGNDFAHTKTIRFVAGLEISEEEFKNNAIFVLLNDQMCINRITERFGNPAVSYSDVNCNYVSTLNREGTKNYKVIKIFNKEKI